MMRMDVQEEMGKYLTSLMDAELTHHLGRKRYERVEDVANHHNGTYSRGFCIKGIGEVELRIPKDRDGEFKTQVIPRSQQYEDAITEDLSLMYLTGVSTRRLSLISRCLIGRNISHQEVSKANKELTEAVERWRNRDLSKETIKYIYVDGVIFSMRVANSVEKVPVLVAIGVAENGSKLVLGIQSGDKESAGSWREFFRELKNRGLKGSEVRLGIMDGLSGLEKVFQEEFAQSKVQRCQVHVARKHKPAAMANLWFQSQIHTHRKVLLKFSLI
jgi:putative transposase